MVDQIVANGKKFDHYIFVPISGIKSSPWPEDARR